MPTAKIGSGNYIYVYNTYGDWVNNRGVWSQTWTKKHYFGISIPSGFEDDAGMQSQPGINPIQAYVIDNKIDDGLPASGKLQAIYNFDYYLKWSTASATYSVNNCFDTTTQKYSIAGDSGSSMNCGISFEFQ